MNVPTFTTRPEIRGSFGVAASTHWMATAVAMGILERGGNAFDAAVGCAFTLQVVEPHLNGPGDEVQVLVVSRQVLEEELGLDAWVGDFVKALAGRFRDLEARADALEHGDPPRSTRALRGVGQCSRSGTFVWVAAFAALSFDHPVGAMVAVCETTPVARETTGLHILPIGSH